MREILLQMCYGLLITAVLSISHSERRIGLTNCLEGALSMEKQSFDRIRWGLLHCCDELVIGNLETDDGFDE